MTTKKQLENCLDDVYRLIEEEIDVNQELMNDSICEGDTYLAGAYLKVIKALIPIRAHIKWNYIYDNEN